MIYDAVYLGEIVSVESEPITLRKTFNIYSDALWCKNIFWCFNISVGNFI